MKPADIRRRNLAKWVEANGVPAAEKSYFSQLLSGVASFGEKAAIRLENTYKMGAGYLSQPLNSVLQARTTEDRATADRDSFDVLQYDEVAGAMGNGLLLPDQPGQITRWTVTTEWLSKNVPSNTGIKNLRIVTGFGDSMRGMFNSGDPLIVDIGVTSVDYDGVYFFRVGDEGFIKRLQRIPGEGIRVISKNPDYEAWTIKPEMDFEVFGRVLKVWKSEEL